MEQTYFRRYGYYAGCNCLYTGRTFGDRAGYAFGIWEGTLLCLVGAVIGSIIVFALVRHFGVKLVEVFYPREKIMSLRFLQNKKRMNLLVILILLIPGTPRTCFLTSSVLQI
jgi:membrane protein DedA with SNARE-associated domain